MGNSQAYEALRRRQGKPPVETFKELFVTPDPNARAEAFDAASAVPAELRLSVRRLLGGVLRVEKGRRVLLSPTYRRSAKHYAQSAKGALDHLEAFLTHFDTPPLVLIEALKLLRFLQRPEGAEHRLRRGGQPLPHYVEGSTHLQKLGVHRDDARAMLRGLGLPIPTGPRPK